MEISIDADEIGNLSRHLKEASVSVGDAVPAPPGASAFGPAVLGSAVALFNSAMRSQGLGLHDRWADLDTGVRGTLADMSEVEERIVAGIERIHGHFA